MYRDDKLVYENIYPAYGDRGVDAVVVRYRVSSVSKFGESDLTLPMTAELTAVPRAPPRVNITFTSLENIGLSWEAP